MTEIAVTDRGYKLIGEQSINYHLENGGVIDDFRNVINPSVYCVVNVKHNINSEMVVCRRFIEEERIFDSLRILLNEPGFIEYEFGGMF